MKVLINAHSKDDLTYSIYCNLFIENKICCRFLRNFLGEPLLIQVELTSFKIYF